MKFTKAEMGIAAAIVVLITLLGVGIVSESMDWEKFKTKHNCRVVEHYKGSPKVGFGYGMTTGGQFGSGVVISHESDKTCWECDDGKRYWR